VAARRLILVLLVLLVLSSIVAALIPVERARNGDSTSSTTSTPSTAAEVPPPTGELVQRRVDAGAANPARIKLPLGSELQLTVSGDKRPDQVEIPVLGELENIDPDFPARFDLLLVEPGSFDVRLVEARRVIARIEVDGKSPG
jgi:hypothetical protein